MHNTQHFAAQYRLSSVLQSVQAHPYYGTSRIGMFLKGGEYLESIQPILTFLERKDANFWEKCHANYTLEKRSLQRNQEFCGGGKKGRMPRMDAECSPCGWKFCLEISSHHMHRRKIPATRHGRWFWMFRIYYCQTGITPLKDWSSIGEPSNFS